MDASGGPRGRWCTSIVYGDAPLSPFLGRHGARMVVAQPMGAGARWLGTVLLGFERQPPLLPPDLRLFSAQVDELGSHVPWALRWSEAEAMRWPGSPPSSLGTRTEVAR